MGEVPAMTLKDARFALNDDGPEWSLRQSLANVWPRLIASEGRISTRAVTQRFSGPGRELRKLASGGAVRWAHMSRATVVSDARKRLRNPSTFKQYSTDLCGPFALLFEFARREPTRYVKALAELLDHGTFSTVGGHTFVAEDDLRSLPAATIPQADWLLAATIRDEENLVEDVDDGEGWEGFTWPTEIVAWIEQILGLRGTLYNVYHTEEMEAIRAAQRAIDAGGVAVVLIDSDMIHDGGTTHRESPIWWRRRKLPAAAGSGWGARKHAQDDNDAIPGHYIVLLGGVRGTDEDESLDFSMRAWSFGFEYEVTGSAEGAAEYIYWVLTGEP